MRNDLLNQSCHWTKRNLFICLETIFNSFHGDSFRSAAVRFYSEYWSIVKTSPINGFCLLETETNRWLPIHGLLHPRIESVSSSFDRTVLIISAPPSSLPPSVGSLRCFLAVALPRHLHSKLLPGSEQLRRKSLFPLQYPSRHAHTMKRQTKWKEWSCYGLDEQFGLCSHRWTFSKKLPIRTLRFVVPSSNRMHFLLWRSCWNSLHCNELYMSHNITASVHLNARNSSAERFQNWYKRISVIFQKN